MQTHYIYDDTSSLVHLSALIASRYTGKERDTESGLDLMGARYYGSTMGRFMSPDPVFPSPERLADPQQWNMYVPGDAAANISAMGDVGNQVWALSTGL